MKKIFTLMRARQRDRRHLLRGAVAAAGSALLAGCDRLSHNESFVETLKSAQHLSRAAHRIVLSRKSASTPSPSRRPSARSLTAPLH